VFHGLGYKGNLGALVMADPHHGGLNGHKPWSASWSASWSAIFANGAPAPLVTSIAASKSFCRSVNATKAYDMTLAGDASFNGGIFLAVAAVDRALKGPMVGESMNKSFGREALEKEMS
jgi:hypothetical protein